MTAMKNWSEYKGALLEGLDTKKAAIVGTLMENAHKENLADTDAHNKIIVTESAGASTTATGNISRYDMMFMPMIRRVMPSLLAMDLVGVQPLQAPRGIVRTIRTRYAEDTKATSGGSITVAAGAEASGRNIYDKYSKLANGGDYDQSDSLNPFSQTRLLESVRGKPMSLDVTTDAVDTMSRKLSATYSLEAADDLNSYDGLDIEAELSASVGDEILREMDREILDTLNALAGTVESFDFAHTDGRYAGERLAALNIAMEALSAVIAQATKKSGATWIVVSPKVFTGMKNASNGTFIPAVNNLELVSSLFVGTFAGNVKVYVDPYLATDSILMGYKGSEIDSGLIYCPFIPLSSSGTMRDPNTTDYVLSMRTRYGLYAAVDPAKSLGNAADYYARMSVANIQLGFTN